MPTETAVPASPAAAAAANPATGVGEPWSTLIGRLDLGGAARQLASNCQMLGRQGGGIRLALDARNKHMRTPAQEEKLAQALSRHFGQPIPVRLEFEMASGDIETPAQAEQRASMEDLDAARRAFESDPGVQGLKERFGATLLPETIRPVKKSNSFIRVLQERPTMRGNIGNMMKQAQQMQANMQKVQAEIAPAGSHRRVGRWHGESAS